MKTKIVEQLEEVIRKTASAEEIAQIEKVIAEVKGKLVIEPPGGFWEGKTPCWEMCRCPDMIKKECPAYKHTNLPCWAIEGTYCKLDDYGARGDDTTICEVCRVYKRCGAGEPIRLQLFGKGINTSLNAIEKLAEKAGV